MRQPAGICTPGTRFIKLLNLTSLRSTGFQLLLKEKAGSIHKTMNRIQVCTQFHESSTRLICQQSFETFAMRKSSFLNNCMNPTPGVSV